MEIRRKKIGNNDWQFVNEFVDRRDGFNHKTTLFKNGCEWLTHSDHYINRTWECYTYETCMRGAVEDLREQQLSRYINNYKYENGISRFRKGEKEKVLEAFKETDISKELDTLKEAIKTRQFD